MSTEGRVSDGYSQWMGMIYVFNLIVGTGALTMPKAFADAGWLLAVLGVIVLVFMSYLTATFMIEAMAAANALVRFKKQRHYERVSSRHDFSSDPSRSESTLVNRVRNDEALGHNIDHDERVHLLVNSSVDRPLESSHVDYFAITEVFEMGRMASMFYNKWGVRLFYVCIAVYLYGDLAIYAAAVAKSLRDVGCKVVEEAEDKPSTICWDSTDINRGQAYRIFLSLFIVAVGPFTFFNVQKTKYLQIFTTILRWTAFLSMITLCFVAIFGGKSEGKPRAAKPLELPTLFGVCVYSFMCHHSLPSIITPIRSKRNIYKLIAGVFLLILGFYNLLSLTGVFTFAELKDTYTLNFEPAKGASILPDIRFIQYFLALFPVITLSSSFPIIAITLQNNLKTLIVGERPPWFLEKIVIPLFALLPPVFITLLTENVQVLVNVTGAYAGAIIQYVVPASLVYLARKQVMLRMGEETQNIFSSPFKSPGWIPFIMGWTFICIILVTVYHSTAL